MDPNGSTSNSAQSLDDLSQFMRNRDSPPKMQTEEEDMPSWLPAFMNAQLAWQELATQRLDHQGAVLDMFHGEVQAGMANMQSRLHRLEKNFGLPDLPPGRKADSSSAMSNSCLPLPCQMTESRVPSTVTLVEREGEDIQTPGGRSQFPTSPMPNHHRSMEDAGNKKKVTSNYEAESAQWAANIQFLQSELDESKAVLLASINEASTGQKVPRFENPTSNQKNFSETASKSTNPTRVSEGKGRVSFEVKEPKGRVSFEGVGSMDSGDRSSDNDIQPITKLDSVSAHQEIVQRLPSISFQLKQPWLDALASATRLKAEVKMSRRTRDVDGDKFRDVMSSEAIRVDRKGRNKIIINPNSTWRFCWDMFGMGLIGFDIVTIPLQFFDLVLPLWFQYSTCIFWTMDMCFGFVLGYYSEGVLEMRLRYVILNYAKSWMIFDVGIVGADWAVIIYGSETDSSNSAADPTLARIGKSLRIVKTLRSLRLLRLVKMKRLLEGIKDRLVTDVSRTVFHVMSLVFLIVAINHVIACAWYGIGAHHQALGYPNWVDSHGFNETSFDYTYISCVHWSLTQFTPAAMEVVPKNTSERAFGVCVLLFAMVVFSAFVSSLTSAMTRFQAQRSERDRQFAILRRFLYEMQVSHFLAVRVQRYLEHVVSTRNRKIEVKDCAILKMLSDPLKMDLDNEIYGPALSTHPFFLHYTNTDSNAMRRICHTSLTRVFLCAGDCLFSSGDACSRMYFVLDGQLQYKSADPDIRRKVLNYREKKIREMEGGAQQQQREVPDRSSVMGIRKFNTGQAMQDPALNAMDHMSQVTHDDENKLTAGDWCCEAALWTPWAHQGVMRAMSICDILGLDTEKFMSVTASHGRIAPHAAVYAEEFVKGLNTLISEGIISDLMVMDVDNFIREAFHSTVSSWHLKSGNLSSSLLSDP